MSAAQKLAGDVILSVYSRKRLSVMSHTGAQVKIEGQVFAALEGHKIVAGGVASGYCIDPLRGSRMDGAKDVPGAQKAAEFHNGEVGKWQEK